MKHQASRLKVVGTGSRILKEDRHYVRQSEAANADMKAADGYLKTFAGIGVT